MTTYRWNNFWTRISTWEYWPAWVFNIPVMFMWLYQAIRNRNLFFFSRVNPAIETGGFFSEQKWPIDKMFPEDFTPNGVLIPFPSSSAFVVNSIKEVGLSFPILAKPNIGERGMGIEKINSADELERHHLNATYDYILQEFIDFPLEMSVLAYRMPESNHVTVTSVCLKNKLTLIGDGQSTLLQLIKNNYRSRSQWPRLSKQFDHRLVLKKGAALLLEPIGNHSRGTTFLNGNHLINKPFIESTTHLFNSISGEVYYGRFDIIYKSIEDYIQLKHFKIIEFNGVGSEPAHIYQPGYPLLKAYKCLWHHAQILGDISLAQKMRGIPSMSFKAFRKALQVYRSNLMLVR